MWAIRVLTGPQAGTSFPLKSGKNIIGRSPHCDIKILSSGVSKEHTEITVYQNNKIIISDLKSSNGTYLNGVKIQNGSLNLGDKVAIHDVILDVIPNQEKKAVKTNPMMTAHGAGSQVPQYANVGHHPAMGAPGYGDYPQSMGANAYAHMPLGAAANGEPNAGSAPAPAYRGSAYQVLQEKVTEYLDRVALPGVYKLAEFLEFKQVLMIFVALFIIITTILSMFPMVQISRASIEKESSRRAMSLAQTVANLNQEAYLNNEFGRLNLNAVEAEDGVKQVLIVNQSDGMILAPATRAGTTADIPFVHTARREITRQVSKIDSTTIGASFPIGHFDPTTGEQLVKAHVIVMYDMGSLAFDDAQAVSLFMQTLLMSFIVGLVLFFFMYKMIEYPIVKLNTELDTAMREKTDSTKVDYNFPALQNLVGNINSLLTRSLSSGGGEAAVSMVSKESEAENVVRIVGYPCIAISKDARIIATNDSFLQLAHSEGRVLGGKQISDIPDGSLQANIHDLISRSSEMPAMTHTEGLEFGGHPCTISCQAVCTGSQPEYFLITVSPNESGV